MFLVKAELQKCGTLTLLDGTLVHRRYLPINVGTHLQLSTQRQIGGNEIASALKANHARCGYRTHDARVESSTLSHAHSPWLQYREVPYVVRNVCA